MSEERPWWTRSQPVVRRACDDNANEMIQDLVGSRVFRGDDDEHAECVWPVVHDGPVVGSARSGRGAITRWGKANRCAARSQTGS
jgi:hypothetical protein